MTDTRTGPLTVRFLNLITGSSSVRSRTFESEDAYVQWLDSVRSMVEIVSVEAA